MNEAATKRAVEELWYSIALFRLNISTSSSIEFGNGVFNS
jgi:hypothetical protein